VKRFFLLLALLAAPAAAQDVAIRAGHVIPGGGVPPLEDAMVLVQGGRIVAIGHGLEVPVGVPTVAHPTGWLVAGFVDPSTTLGALGEADDIASALEPDASVAPNVAHRDFARARAAGITAALVAPGDLDLVGGAARLLKTTGARLGDAPLAKLSLHPWAYRPDRPPTSRAGAADLLRRTLAEAHNAGSESGEADPTDAGRALLVGFARGELAGLWTVGTPLDLRLGRDLASPYGLRVLWRLAPWFTAEDVDEAFSVAGRGPSGLSTLGVVVGPFALESPPALLRVPAAVKAAGQQVLFTSGAPGAPPGALRLSAALAVRHGLPADVALDALTRAAAEALGVADRIGTIEAGKDGDLVVLDGPPLDPATRVLETWVEGRRVHQAGRSQ
jgi:hypothetical protein